MRKSRLSKSPSSFRKNKPVLNQEGAEYCAIIQMTSGKNKTLSRAMLYIKRKRIIVSENRSGKRNREYFNFVVSIAGEILR
jgi:hypothetical protein